MYLVSIKKSALKELSNLPSAYQVKIITAIDALAINPRPDGVKKLRSSENECVFELATIE